MGKNRSITTNIIIFIIMACIAIIDNTKGIFIPAFKESFNSNNTSMGIMLTACSLGYILFTYLGGILCEKLSQKKVINIGLISIIISVLIVSVSGNFVLLLAGMFLTNMGIAFVMIGLNTLIPVLFVSCQAIMMNISHCCYGFGSTIGQLAIGRILNNGVNWRYVFIGISVIFTIVFILVFKVRLPKVESQNKTKLTLAVAFKEKYMYLYALALGTYVFAEMGMSNWVVNYLIEGYGFDQGRAATLLSTFFFFLTIGRLCGGFIAEKIGHLQSVIGSLIVALALMVIGLVIGHGAIVLLCVSGLFFAIVYPTTVTTISRVFESNTSYITGVILTLASTISMIMNFIIGRLNDVIGTSTAFYLIPVSLGVSVLFMVTIFIGKREVFTRGGK